MKTSSGRLSEILPKGPTIVPSTPSDDEMQTPPPCVVAVLPRIEDRAVKVSVPVRAIPPPEIAVLPLTADLPLRVMLPP